MSPDTIEVGIFTIVATLSGVVVGSLVERLYRSWGRLWCEPSRCEVRYVAPDEMGGHKTLDPDEMGGHKTLDPEEAGDDWGAEYAVGLDLYNGKEVPVGLRDISVVVSYDAAGEKQFQSRPWDAMSGQFSYGRTTYATLTLVNLAPRQWVRLELLGVLEGAKISKGWRRIEFVAERCGLFGTLREFRKVVASR